MNLSFRSVTLILLLLVAASGGWYAHSRTATPITEPTLTLTDENYTAWRDHILPRDAELDYLQIPWKLTFADGLAEAARQKKPLLLWTMNGHPLGCT